MNDWFGGSNSLQGTSLQVETRPLMRMVYMWMALGLAVTGVISMVVYSTPSLFNLARNPAVMMVAIIGELVLVFALSLGLRRMSPGVAIAMFLIYAAVNGFTLSIIFLVYKLGTISMAFFSTAAAFGAMSVLGYTTEIDLSRYRSYFLMGLIGVIAASLVNIFLGSSLLDLGISIFGVFLFLGITAWDTQRIKQMAADPSLAADGNALMKVAIWGALKLYLDFINLFLMLLRLFGRRR